MTKVVIASHGFFPEIGGVTTTISILAKAFVDQGDEVTLVTIIAGNTKDHGYPVIRNPSPLLLYRLYKSADILIITNLAIKLIYPLLIIRRKFALQYHSESGLFLSNSLISFDTIRRYVKKRAFHFMVSRYLGVTSGLINYQVTYPYVNLSVIKPNFIRSPSDRSGVLFVGRLVLDKGVNYILQRRELISKTLHEDILSFVGDDTCRGSINKYKHDHSDQNIRCLGEKSAEEVAEIMGKTAFVIVPSLCNEAFGAVAIEAIAAGAILIYSTRGGLPEAAGDFGFPFNPDIEESFKNALINARALRTKVLGSRDSWNDYITAGRKHVSQFNPQDTIQKITDTILSKQQT